MGRRCAWPTSPVRGRTWSCVRCPSTAGGTTSAIRASTSRWAGMRPRSTWKKSNRWSPERNLLMNPKILASRWQQLPEKAVRELQAESLRQYLGRVVLPFSPYYRKLFAQHGLRAESIRTLEDLEQIPFTSKADLVNTPENPQKVKDFLIIPDERTLTRRPGTILRAAVSGRAAVKRGFEDEF